MSSKYLATARSILAADTSASVTQLERAIAEALDEAEGEGRRLALAKPPIEPHPEIARIAAQAEALASRVDFGDDDEADEEAQEELERAIARLDRRAGPELAIGRVLYFQIGDGHVGYIVDAIADLFVHCVWIANGDRYTAEAVPADGWTLRAIAEAKIAQDSYRYSSDEDEELDDEANEYKQAESEE